MYVHPAPLAETVSALRSGSISLAEHIVQMCQRREQVEPHVQAFVPEPDPCSRLRSEADALHAQFPTPDSRPSLFGALVGVKDILRVNGFPTRAGSLLPPEVFDGPEADVVTALRRAGVLIAGKTVTTEFAYFEPGPTRNPHNLNHTPGGSSSGSAAAVAAGLCHLALGTQTIGSVIRPAAFCGIVGYKPTYNRIPTDGLIFFSRSADHIGLFTQDVAGMRLAARVVCEGWDEQKATAATQRRPILGIPDGPYLQQAEEEGLVAFETHVRQLQEAGYEVRRVPTLDDIATINRVHRQMIAAEFAMEHAEWFARYGDLYRPRTVDLIREGQKVTAEELAVAREGQARYRAQIEAQMEDAGIDLWICPAAPGPAPEGINSTGNPIMNLPWTYMGLPAVTVPAGKASNGLPLGLQIVGHWMADEALLAWAEEMARVFQGAGGE